MTICVGVKVRDGVVLGTDSMTQISVPDAQGQYVVAKTYRYARKLFHIGELPIGMVTWGPGNIGSHSVSSLIWESTHNLNVEASVEEAAQSVFETVLGAYQVEFSHLPQEEKPVLGVHVAGYSAEGAFPQEHKIQFPEAFVRKIDPDYGARWYGFAAPFTRLHMGYDPKMMHLFDEMGAPEALKDKIFREHVFETHVSFDVMPVQDAVRFVVYVLRTTIGFSSFDLSITRCGGPLQVAAITRADGFQWINEPKLRMPEEGHE